MTRGGANGTSNVQSIIE
jgi:hypothetical protein